MLRSISKRVLLFALVALFSLGCFQYSEAVKLNQDLSGEVTIEYLTPLRKTDKGHASLLAHLPYLPKKIKKKYNADGVVVTIIKQKVTKAKKLKPKKKVDTTFVKLHNKITHYGEVKLKIEFQNWISLQKILAGKVTVQEVAGVYEFRRQLKGSTLKTANISDSQRSIIQYTKKFFQKKAYTFSVAAPDNFKVAGHNCDSLAESICGWVIPMKELVSGVASKTLFIKLTL